MTTRDPQQTAYPYCHRGGKRLANNKKELLLVLERPDIPLRNNLSEGDIREYVIKRKISGSTGSEIGRRCRDTFAILNKEAIDAAKEITGYPANHQPYDR